jgi:hypothetical protein
MSMAAFIVCNVTLREHNWEDCVREWTAARGRGEKHLNGGRPLELDTRSLAHRLATARGCSSKMNLKAISRVSLQLPTFNLTLDPMLAEQTREWFRRTGAEHPKATSSSSVLVLDEQAMTSAHVELVVKELGLCATNA